MCLGRCRRLSPGVSICSLEPAQIAFEVLRGVDRFEQLRRWRQTRIRRCPRILPSASRMLPRSEHTTCNGLPRLLSHSDVDPPCSIGPQVPLVPCGQESKSLGEIRNRTAKLDTKPQSRTGLPEMTQSVGERRSRCATRKRGREQSACKRRALNGSPVPRSAPP